MNSKKIVYSAIVCIGTILLSSLIVSCGCDDCGPMPIIKEPYFVNATDEDVTVTVDIPIADGYTTSGKQYFKTIIPGDSLTRESTSSQYVQEDGFYVPANDECGLVIGSCGSPTVSLEFRFLGAPERCISFTGPVKDSINDPRSWNAYEEGGRIYDSDHSFVLPLKYIFKITEAMKDTASLCE
jgi:hypothetical protein